MAASTKTVAGQISFFGKDNAEVRTVGQGDRATSVVNFSLFTNQRKKQGDEWVNDEPIITNCEAWGRLADNIAKSFNKGDLVLVTGEERSDSFENKEGETVNRVKLRVSDAGPSVFFDSATSNREARGNSGGGNSGSSSKSSASSSNSSSKKSAAPAKEESFDLDLDFGDDLGDDDDAPF